MKIIGLTGSIGMGKSETAKMFQAAGIAVFDSDATVHKLQAVSGDALPMIAAVFPGVVEGGVLNRARLGDIVFKNPQKKRALEAIMFPLLDEARTYFITDARQKGHSLVIIDAPLLFETGLDRHCDKIVVVSAPQDVQRARVMARPHMSRAKFESILNSQMPDQAKRDKADFLIDSSKGFAHAKRQVADIISQVTDGPN